MATFRDIFSSRGQKEPHKIGDPSPAGPETLPVKMNLEERMAFRRELLFETVKVTLNNHSIDARSYRFKVMRTDKRGHCYVVMLDMSPDFMSGEQGNHQQLAKLAAELTSNAQTRYGLVVGGVYWRVDETLATPIADWAKATLPAESLPAQNQISSNIEKYETASASELAAFEAAWQTDKDIRIGDRTYSSDRSPLDADPPRE
jgi:hypothetical protein